MLTLNHIKMFEKEMSRHNDNKYYFNVFNVKYENFL